MDDLSIDRNLSTFEELMAAYAESHRHYHTATHIDACLSILKQHRGIAIEPAEVELAIWFHEVEG